MSQQNPLYNYHILTKNFFLKNEGQENKTETSGGKYQGERGGHKERVKGYIWQVYFIFMYENRTMNHVEIVLRRGEGR
jgi:hypothetical protein